MALAENDEGFLHEVRYEVVDDHVPLLDAGIPTSLLIDVDDPAAIGTRLWIGRNIVRQKP